MSLELPPSSPEEGPSLDLRRYLLASLAGVSGLVAAGFCVYHWSLGLPGRALASASAVLAALIIAGLLWATRSHRPAVAAATAYAALMTLGLLGSDTIPAADFVWCFIVPTLIAYAGGRQLARWLLPLYLVSATIIVLAPGFANRALWLELELHVRFLGLLTLVSAAAFLYELTRGRAQAKLQSEVDERRAAQRELARANALLQEVADESAQLASQAQAANLAKTRFLSHMSHDIRTPLTGIVGMTSVLELTELSEEQRHCVDTIRVSGEALAELIGDVLDLSRIDAGKVQLKREPVEPAALLEGVRTVLEGQAAAKGLALRCSLDPGLPVRLQGDTARLRQILLNLAGNAVKFTARGHVTLRASVHPAGNPHWWRLEVQDSGIGVEPEQHQRIFESFSQVDLSNTRRHGGTGLGLAICSRLVALMGGSIDLESDLGRGSRFWVDLPLQQVEADVAPAPEPGPPIKLRPLQVLVVDDNAIVRQVMGDLLRMHGHHVEEAEDGEVALVRLALREFDVVLMDVQMPLMDGLEACSVLRAREAGGPRVPVVGVTALADPDTRQACLAAGMDRVITKPVQHRDLLRVLAELLSEGGPGQG